MNQILIISGPTATGKTNLAIKLAKLYNGELISADSRQIYQGMDIGTGKDHLPNVMIHLVDIIKPSQSFSVAQYQSQVLAIIADIHSRHKLPIIVGGTGQYLDSIINPNKSTYSIKPLPFLRFFLNKLSTKTIQKIYRFINPVDFATLNNSEIHNPHRLIRKIEIKLSNNASSPLFVKGGGGFDFLHLSLTAPNEFIYPSIDKRVEKRLKIGLITEIKTLLTNYNWSHPGLNTLAYKQFQPYFDHQFTLSECIKNWTFDEHAYARRQKTWFKKMADVNFIDITSVDSSKNIQDLVAKWYNKPCNRKKLK